MQWGIIRSANDTQVMVGPFADYDNATDWAKAFSGPMVGCKIVPFYSPNTWLDDSNEPKWKAR